MDKREERIKRAFDILNEIKDLEIIIEGRERKIKELRRKIEENKETLQKLRLELTILYEYGVIVKKEDDNDT